MNSFQELVAHLKRIGVLKSKYIINAFLHIDRKDFVTTKYSKNCYEDRPLSIGEGQTISQPTTVAFMLELLGPQPGDRILDVGSGSGWTTGLLAYIVGDKGRVWGVESLPKLVSFGKTNLKKYGYRHADIQKAGDALGLPEKGTFDKILVSAESKSIPQELINQLKRGGIMVIPIQNAVWKIKKGEDEMLKIEKYEGFVFVPLI